MGKSNRFVNRFVSISMGVWLAASFVNISGVKIYAATNPTDTLQILDENGKAMDLIEIVEMTCDYEYVDSESQLQIEQIQDEIEDEYGVEIEPNDGSIGVESDDPNVNDTVFSTEAINAIEDAQNEIDSLEEFSSGRLMLGINSSISAYGAVAATEILGDGFVVLQYESAEEAELAYEYYLENDSVEYVEADSACIQTEEYVETESTYTSWGYGSATSGVGFTMNMAEYQNEYLTGTRLSTPIIVAVLDTGLTTGSSLFYGRTVARVDYITSGGDGKDSDGHGTHCAGIIADGTPKNVKIYSYKVLPGNGQDGNSSTVISGIYAAVKHGASVISMSLSGPGSLDAMDTAITYAGERGVIVCVAAGNQSIDASTRTPGNSPYTITVGAMDTNGGLADYSNYGSELDIVAPGSSIESASINGGTVAKSGTSMATPHVSAVAVLMKLIDSNMDYFSVLSAMQNSGTQNGFSRAKLSYQRDGHNYSVPRLMLGKKTHFSINGICYIYNENDISVGVSVNSYGKSFECKWMAYNLDTGVWSQITDWYGGNWASWRPEVGNYWLQAQVRTDSTTITHTICFANTKNYNVERLTLDGFCYIYQSNRIDIGTAYTADKTVQFQWLAYNLDTGTWSNISDWTTSNWVSWQPKKGNYWVVVNAKSSTGKTAQNILCFSVDRNYPNDVSLNGICYNIYNDRIDAGVAYETSDPNITFQWLAYNLDTQTWSQISGWSTGNWTSWKPSAGNYWLVAQAKLSDGSIETYTICFYADKSY